MKSTRLPLPALKLFKTLMVCLLLAGAALPVTGADRPDKGQKSLLTDLARSGNYLEAIELLRLFDTCPLRCPLTHNDYFNLLDLAARDRDYTAVTTLLDLYRHNLKSRPSLLIMAARLGSYKAVKMLVESGENPLERSPETFGGALPLHFAARAGSLESVEYLLKLHPETINVRSYPLGSTPLLSALEGQFDDRSGIYSFLLSNPDLDPNICDYSGRAAIHYAKEWAGDTKDDLDPNIIEMIKNHPRFKLTTLYCEKPTALELAYEDEQIVTMTLWSCNLFFAALIAIRDQCSD